MKITFLSPPPNLSGGQRVVSIYADRLTARGHEVTIVARRRNEPTLAQRAKYWLRKQRYPSESNYTHFDGMTAHFHISDTPGALTANDVPDADVVIATWWETAFETVTLPPSKGRKFYFIQHHEVHDHLPKHISGGSYFLPLKKITISSWLVETMHDLYGDGDVALVHNSVDQDQFFAPERERQTQPTVGLLYSPIRFKGVDIALQAIKIALISHPDLKLVAFGSQLPTRELQLPDGTEFHLNPPQDKLRDIYASCDVFLAASRLEGFGLPIIEAMACRCPVVATKTGCASDIIRDATNGFVVEIEDAADLGARLSDVLSLGPVSWRAMSDAAWQSVQNYTWDDATDAFEVALKRI